ncbi:hypothetical protein M8J76_007478 [Diaphorina citri]|nr:hypothetical protein M8J76_007478 [Diaphorina citri]
MGGTTNENEDFALPILVQETISQSPCKSNPTEVPPPSISVSETAVTDNVDHDRNVLKTLDQQKQSSETQSKNAFDERILELLSKILAGEPPPTSDSTSAPEDVLPDGQVLNKVIDNSETEENLETARVRSEPESLKLQKTRGDLKTRINIRRCTIEHTTESDQDQQSNGKHDTRSKHKSRRLLRSKSYYDKIKAKSSTSESKLESKKLSDVSTDEETESFGRKQSLRSQQQANKNSPCQSQVKDVSSQQPGKDNACPQPTKDVNCQQSTKDFNCQQPIKDITCSQPTKDIVSQQPPKAIITCPQPTKDNDCQQQLTKDSNCQQPTKDICQQLNKDSPCVRLKIKLSDIKQGKNENEKEGKIDKKDKSSDAKGKNTTEKKRITRASVVDEPSCASTTSIDNKLPDTTENTVSVKSLRSRQRVSYVEAVEEQFATFDSSESEDESLYKKMQEKNKKKKQQKVMKNLVSSTKETQVTENIFDCNVLINNVQINQIQIKQTEIRQNVKFNKKQRSVSCENKDVLINKKSLRSVKSFCRMEETDGENKEKSQSLSNLDQITVASQNNPTSSFNNEFIDFLKNTVRPEPVIKSPVCKSTNEKANSIEPSPSEEVKVTKDVSTAEVEQTDVSVETNTDDTHSLVPEITQVGMAVQTEITDIPNSIELTGMDKVEDTVVIEPNTNSGEEVVDKSLEEETDNSINEARNDNIENSFNDQVDNIESTITDVIKASCNVDDEDDVAPENEIPTTNRTVIGHKKPATLKQTRKRTQIERITLEEPPSCKKMRNSFDEQPIPFTELMIPEVVLTVNEQDLPVSVNIGTMCEPITASSNLCADMDHIHDTKPAAKVTKHVDTCEKSVSTDVTKIQFSIYPDTTPSTSTVAVGSSNMNKEMYNYFDNLGKQLTLYGNSSTNKKPNYYDNEGNKPQNLKSKNSTPLFSSTASTSSIRSVIQTKSVSSVSITPMNLSPASVSHKAQVTSYPSDDMPIDLSKKPCNNQDTTDLARTRPVIASRSGLKPRSDPQESCIRRSTSTTPDCIAYKQAVTRDSTTPESVCKLGSSSTTPDSVYSSHDPVPRPSPSARNTNTNQARGARSTVYELPRQSPQTMQMMHTRLWDMQELPYHSMLINENPAFQEHLPQAQLMNAPNLLPMQTLSPSEYTAQRNLFIANQMYVSALQAFQDAANSSTSQKSYAAPNKKRSDGTEAGRRKKVRDVMTNVPVLSYEQLQQSNIGLERRLEENVFQYQTSSTTAQSTSVIQRTEVSSDQSTLTYIHNTPDEDCPQLPNILENYSNLQSYGLNPNIVSQIQNLSTNRTTKAKSKTARR